jgi:hypothetical protein
VIGRRRNVYVTFTAEETGTAEMDGVVTTGVRAGDEYLMFSRGLDDEEMEDWGVYLEYRDQINGAYDCINACVLGREHLDLDLSKPIDRGKEIEGFHRCACPLGRAMGEPGSRAEEGIPGRTRSEIRDVVCVRAGV